jgi:tetratricopeptide (TPR) repeat protein
MRAAAALVAAGLLTAAGFEGRRLDALESPAATDAELLYLPNGRHLRVLSLGHAPLVADAIYVWAIQHYSAYGREDRGKYVEHVFGDVITELDPRFVDPYWLGSLILIVENRDLEAGLRLLDKGFASNPGSWIFPYLAGWECARAQDYARAVVYFERAAAVPAAPANVRRIIAGMYARSGNLDDALASWQAVLADPASDATSRAIAERQVKGLVARRDVQMLQGAVARFREATGRYPETLAELRRTGLLPTIPMDPENRPYAYDPRSGTVGSGAERVLGAP